MTVTNITLLRWTQDSMLFGLLLLKPGLKKVFVLLQLGFVLLLIHVSVLVGVQLVQESRLTRKSFYTVPYFLLFTQVLKVKVVGIIILKSELFLRYQLGGHFKITGVGIAGCKWCKHWACWLLVYR
jgi:hypothetical protein